MRRTLRKKPKVLRKLARELTDSLQAYKAQRPTSKADGQPIPWPADILNK